jgi:hypothetical protein
MDRDRHNDRERGERQAFDSRPQQPQPERPEPAADAGPPQQEQQPTPPTPTPTPTPRRRERFQPQQTHEQPEFLRRPVRRARNEEETPDSTGNGNAKEEPSRE